MGSPVVLHVLEALETGCARHVVDVVRHADGIGHHVAVPRRRVGGITDQQARAAMADAGAIVHLVEMRRAPIRPHNVLAVAAVRRLLSRVRPAVVHGHSSIGGAVARTAAAGKGVSRLYTPNGITSLPAGLRVERALSRWTDRLVAVSPSEGDRAVALGLVDRARLVVIPNGIDVERPEPPIDLRARLGLPPEVPLVASVGRLVPQKAPERFVQACAWVATRHPDAHFLLVGAGPLASRVDAEVAAAALAGRFHRLAVVPEVAGTFSQLTAFVLASRYEGLPYTALEALRAGVAVVLTDVVGNRDVIGDSEAGILVPPEDPAAMADALARLLASPDQRARLGAAGMARVRAHFDVRQMGASLGDLYRQLAGCGADHAA